MVLRKIGPASAPRGELLQEHLKIKRKRSGPRREVSGASAATRTLLKQRLLTIKQFDDIALHTR